MREWYGSVSSTGESEFSRSRKLLIENFVKSLFRLSGIRRSILSLCCIVLKQFQVRKLDETV